MSSYIFSNANAVVPRYEAGASSVISDHISISANAAVKIRNLVQTSKTSRIHGVMIADSNGGSYIGTLARFSKDNFARQLDRNLEWLRGNVDFQTNDTFLPQSQVIMLGTWGLGKSVATPDLPWHPEQKRLIGDFSVALGPFGSPHSEVAGNTRFLGPSVSNRFIGFIVDRTNNGQEWERMMNRVAVRFYQGTTGQTIAQGPTASDGTSYVGGAYSGPFSTFTMELRDVSAIDFSTIPSTGWSSSNPACASIKSAIMALTPYATLAVNPTIGGAAPKPGLTSPWLSGILPNAKTLVTLRVADGAGMGSLFTSLILDDSTRTGGVSVYGYDTSGRSLQSLEWRRTNMNGTDAAGFSGGVSDFVTSNYAMPSLASSLLMWGENTYSRSGYFGGFTGTHNVIGLDFAVLALSINDISGTTAVPLVLYKKVKEICEQCTLVNPNVVLFFVLPPCIGFAGGDNVRDNWYTGSGGVRATNTEFYDEIKRAAGEFPDNAIVMDFQKFYGDIAPTALKSRLGHFGVYRRASSDPIDVLHFKPSCWLSLAAAHIGDLFRSTSFQI
jgi:hypothetical protein